MKAFASSRMIRNVVMMACLAVAGMGCIKIDSTVIIARDGSGSCRTMYAMPTFLIKQMEATRQLTRSLILAEGKSTNAPLPALDIPMIFDETVLSNKLMRLDADGIKLENLRARDQGGWRYVDFTLKFSRLDSLVKQSFFKDCGFTFTHAADDTCKLVVTLPPVGVSSELPSLSNPEALAKLTPFLNGMRVVVRIDFPGDIRNSTSTMSDSRRGTWEWDFDKDIHVLERLTQEKIIAVFDGSLVRMKAFEKPAGGTSLIIK